MVDHVIVQGYVMLGPAMIAGSPNAKTGPAGIARRDDMQVHGLLLTLRPSIA